MVRRIIDPEGVNFLPFGLFLSIALDYAEEMFPVFFTPEEISGSKAPAIREAWESIPDIREMLGPQERFSGSWEHQPYPETHPAAADQVLNLFYLLREVFESDSSHCYSFFRNPVPEGAKVNGLGDWNTAVSRFGQWHTERDYRAFTPSRGPWGLSDKGVTDYILHCLIDFPCFNNWPSERSDRHHIPIEIHTKKTEYGEVTETVLDKDSPDLLPDFQVWQTDIYWEFQVILKPWFTVPYTYGILLNNRVPWDSQTGLPQKVNLGGREYGNEGIMLYAEASSAPVTGTQRTPVFKMPTGEGMCYWWTDLRIYVQPVLTNFLETYLQGNGTQTE